MKLVSLKSKDNCKLIKDMADVYGRIHMLEMVLDPWNKVYGRIHMLERGLDPWNKVVTRMVP